MPQQVGGRERRTPARSRLSWRPPHHRRAPTALPRTPATHGRQPSAPQSWDPIGIRRPAGGGRGYAAAFLPSRRLQRLALEPLASLSHTSLLPVTASDAPPSRDAPVRIRKDRRPREPGLRGVDSDTPQRQSISRRAPRRSQSGTTPGACAVVSSRSSGSASSLNGRRVRITAQAPSCVFSSAHFQVGFGIVVHFSSLLPTFRCGVDAEATDHILGHVRHIS